MRAATEDPKGGRGNTASRSTDDPRAQAAAQQELAKALEKAADRLASATGAPDGESQKLSAQRARAQQLREQLAETSRALGQMAQAGAGGSGQAGEAGRAGEAGEAGGAGRAAGQGQSGASAQKSPGETGRSGEGQAGGGGGNGTDLEKLREQYQKQLQETKALADEMRRDDPALARGGGGGFSFDAPTSVGLSAPGTEAFKQDFAKWEEMRRQATQVLDNVEASLSKKLQARQAHDRLAAGADDKAPAGYQKQVDEYFKAIAGRRRNRLMHFAYPLPWWLAVLLAAAVGAVAYRRVPAPAVSAHPGAARPARGAADDRACGASCCSCSGRSRCCRPPERAMRSCRFSSTCRAACGLPTPTARRVSLAPTAC